MKRIFSVFIIMLILLTACASRDADFDDFFSSGEPTPGIGDTPAPGNTTPEDEVTITLLVCEYRDAELRVYSRLFRELYPHVNIKIETYDFVIDNTTHLALITRLLADPPDILQFIPRYVSFEKMSMEALFINYNELFNGPRGISMDNYFSNIFNALEVQGGLYNVPLYIDLMLAYPNIELFKGAGIDISAISSVSVDDEINFYTQIAPAFPNEILHPSLRFSIWRALTQNPLYNIDTGVVNANTVEMAQRLKKALEIPVNTEIVIFSPDFIEQYEVGITTISRSLIGQDPLIKNLIFHDHIDGSSGNLTVFFMQKHPDIQFANPVPFSFGNQDNITFRSESSLSIMKDSANADLAWEFVRFILEYEDSLHHVESYYASIASAPINKNRFTNQLTDVLQTYFDWAVRFTDIEDYIDDSLDEYEKQQTLYALSYLSDIMKRLNYEHRQNFTMLLSLVYPDVWLIHSGQQTVEQGLSNIQSRLELYVNE